MDPGWGAARHMREVNEWKGGRGEQERQSFGSGISKGRRIQKPNGRLARLPGSAFVRLWPPCAEEAGGRARDPASATAAVSPQPPRAGGEGGAGERASGCGALCGPSPRRAGSGGGLGGEAGAGLEPPPARLAPQLLRWHLQGCGGPAAAALRGWPVGDGWVGEGGLQSFPSPRRREGSSVNADFSPRLGSGAFFHYPGWTFKNKNYF